MDWTPFFASSPLVKFHLLAGTAALVLGFVQFIAPKGTIPHRSIGWFWAVLMVALIGVSFFIREFFVWGFFSTDLCVVPSKDQPWMVRCALIYTTSMYALLLVPYAVLHARRGNIEFHRWSMLSILLGAVAIAGGFAFQEPRMLHTIFFGS